MLFNRYLEETTTKHRYEMYLVEARELMVSACARLQIEQPVRARALDQTQDHFRINFSHFLNASLDAHPCI